MEQGKLSLDDFHVAVWLPWLPGAVKRHAWAGHRHLAACRTNFDSDASTTSASVGSLLEASPGFPLRLMSDKPLGSRVLRCLLRRMQTKFALMAGTVTGTPYERLLTMGVSYLGCEATADLPVENALLLHGCQ